MTAEQLRFIAAMTQDAGAAYSHNERALGRDVAKRMHTHQVARIQAVRNLLDLLGETIQMGDLLAPASTMFRGSNMNLVNRLKVVRDEIQESGK